MDKLFKIILGMLIISYNKETIDAGDLLFALCGVPAVFYRLLTIVAFFVCVCVCV